MWWMVACAGPELSVADVSVELGEEAVLAVEREPSERDTYTWSLRSKPPLSRAALDVADGPDLRFVPDRVGLYVVDLVVARRRHEDRATALVTVTAPGDAPIAEAGPDRAVFVGAEAYLLGTGSTSPTGAPLTYAWRLLEAPAGSLAAIVDPGSALATLSPDVPGTYRVDLGVHDGSRESERSTVEIRAVEEGAALSGDVPNGIFDPGEVYILGSVDPDDPCALALAHWSDPALAVGGFSCSPTLVGVRVDGRLLYTESSEDAVREFHCDDCPGWSQGDRYPALVLDNDVTFTAQACVDGGGIGIGAVTGIDGRTLLNCPGGWYDERGDLVAPPLVFYSLGHDGVALSDGVLLDIDDGTEIPIVGLPVGVYITARVRPTGFWVALEREDRVQRWSVDQATGVATLDGEYPDPPPGYLGGTIRRLDRSGRLVQRAYRPQTSETAVMWRDLDGGSELVFTSEAPSWLVDADTLVTGP